MSIIMAFGFVPEEGFTLGSHNSFDPAIPHQFIHVLASMARRKYRHIDYSPTTITLAAKENWPPLVAAVIAPRSLCKPATAPAIVPTTAFWPLREATATTVVAVHMIAPRPFRNTATATPTISTTAAWPFRQAATIATVVPTIAPRSLRKTTTVAAPSLDNLEVQTVRARRACHQGVWLNGAKPYLGR
ncbi:hypothetical protein ACLOJK_022872 [Asimina triloba]